MGGKKDENWEGKIRGNCAKTHDSPTGEKGDNTACIPRKWNSGQLVFVLSVCGKNTSTFAITFENLKR